jgi:hypothetical protein
LIELVNLHGKFLHLIGLLPEILNAAILAHGISLGLWECFEGGLLFPEVSVELLNLDRDVLLLILKVA